MAAIMTTNGAVPLIVSRPPATAVAQATGTVTTTKTAAPTKTTRATPHWDQTPSAALPPTATNATLSDAAQYDSRSLGTNDYTLVVYLQDVYHISDLHFTLFSVGRGLHMDRHKKFSITPQESTLATCDGKFTTTYDEDTGFFSQFDKLHKTVEIRESTTLTDSHLASVSLSSLPDCIEHDVQVWPGARPSIPDTQLREFLPQHWYELTKMYHDF
ncbi:hypothetical protein DYB31_004228 [Aphanomyces astaci]|uniref:Uncharacterized protein n=1 Tax=Aphanomyces astaci TaxID=112090 RepID=A0A397EMA1_APHAT|nr:hypothetical protein DYB31_004228 [Aphanomyces astaci]